MANPLRPFQHVAGLRPRRSVFSNSYYKVFDCNLGQLIPVMADFFMPGDHVRLGAEAVVRANPLVAPIMHQINLKVDYWAVPIRLLWPKPDYKDKDGNSLGYTPDISSWEEFITGGVTGDLEPVQPSWNPTVPLTGVGTLWDYMGMSLNVPPVGKKVVPWAKRAYQMIYNEYFRDQNMEDPVDLDDETLHKAKYEKDYFTSALFETQRGTAPSIRLSGVTNAVFDPVLDNVTSHNVIWPGNVINATNLLYMRQQTGNAQMLNSNNLTVGSEVNGAVRTYTPSGYAANLSNNNTVNLQNVGTFDVNDLRYIVAIQRHMERAMRAGSRLTEHILAHWGVHNGDSRLQRPEYIGGIRSPVIISEVLQTSQTVGNQALGYMGGHGIAYDQSRVGSYFCTEECIIVGIMRLMPRAVYQQGINRQWLYETRFEYPTPELVNLGEQEVYNMELVATNNGSHNADIFGYQGRYDEHRTKQNMVCGNLRNTVPAGLGFWHLARYFDINNPPALNKEFLEVTDDRRYSVVQSMPGFIVTYGNRIRRVAPLPIVGTPGIMDHN